MAKFTRKSFSKVRIISHGKIPMPDQQNVRVEGIMVILDNQTRHLRKMGDHYTDRQGNIYDLSKNAEAE